MMLLRTTLRPRVLRLAAFRPIRLSSTTPFIHIQDGTFYKKYPTADDSSNPPLFPNLNFSLPSETGADKEHWAIIGPSDRTDLLHILRGQHICLPPTARSYPYLLTDTIAAKDPRLRSVSNAIQYIGFSGEGSEAIGGTRGAYLSARYESLREETDWTVLQYLRGQTSLNPMEGEEAGTVHDEEFLARIIADLNMSSVLHLPVANLSNGQTRRARIAKALLGQPELLLLDEPFMGLDPATVKNISELLHDLAKRSAPRLILALRPQDKVPDWITHMMILGNSHQIFLQGPRSTVYEKLDSWANVLSKKVTSKKSKAAQDKIFEDAGITDKDLIRDLVAHRRDLRFPEFQAPLGGEPVIEMEGVHVQYGDKPILGNWEQKINGEKKDGLHWRVRRGQRWAILGANGSGKTTLLSMITSDHPQTYAQPVKIFGRSRLPENGKPGISIFELQSRIGHSSPELHAFFPRQLTIRGALESAFAETFLSKPKLTVERDDFITLFLHHFRAELDPNFITAGEIPQVSTDHFPNLKKTAWSREKYTPVDHYVDYADEILFGELTTAQQRIVLFLRTLVNKPDIVILDEAFSGLSASQRDKCLYFLEHGEKPTPYTNLDKFKFNFTGLTEDQALIMISHVPDEIPDSVRYYLRLPSSQGAGADADADSVDFRFGILRAKTALRNPSTWDLAWSPSAVFAKEARRTFRRNQSELPVQDMSEFEWWTI
ncbi:hypothetical protein N7457_004228 [Penicillium paradoxum]|uniref:uncharacterized protein n=1 Tax=Penicillium paradoxum TaxID=176176 RepID=UPI0025493938|nr:uncharacterized protein N7457_004228 [Penicillium paradoxum]KAJ5782454.1 hypothetical protein N7457_004228 [Penicillium paradoxum]